MPSFDTVLEPNFVELRNAVEQSNKEIATRFDFKGSAAKIDLIETGSKERDLMLHADSTYADHPWAPELRDDVRRGLGAELRVLGLDPDAVAAAAEEAGGTVLQPAQDKPHGWRETIFSDPEGYTWAVGRRLG